MDTSQQAPEPGDLIRMRVSGTLMTVEFIDPTGTIVHNIYFVGNELHVNNYRPNQMLKVVPTPRLFRSEDAIRMIIQVGDSVRLKSGGPIMAVENIDSAYRLVECVWHDGNRTNRRNFGIDTLKKATSPESANTRTEILPPTPVEITDSLKTFQAEHPDPRKAAFIMMRFTETNVHSEIVRVIQQTTQAHSIVAMRADHKEYHDDTFANIKTYMHGCGFGIAVFERIEQEEFNPNVGLELGYMIALSKPVLLLKDKTLKTLQADLNGKLYKPFDTRNPGATLPGVIEKWLKDKGFA